MGQQSNKYHISDNGDVFRVNQDGSFTSMGNVEGQDFGSKAKNYNLREFENRLINGDTSQLSIDEVKFVAENSQNSDAVLKASEYDEEIIIPILVKRFEDGVTFLEGAVLCGCEYDKNETVKLAVANCKRKFNEDGILTTLGKDKNHLISNAAKRNPNYTGKGGGCLGSILIFVIATLSFMTIFI